VRIDTCLRCVSRVAFSEARAAVATNSLQASRIIPSHVRCLDAENESLKWLHILESLYARCLAMPTRDRPTSRLCYIQLLVVAIKVTYECDSECGMSASNTAGPRGRVVGTPLRLEEPFVVLPIVLRPG
jgi:hypothetical protein